MIEHTLRLVSEVGVPIVISTIVLYALYRGVRLLLDWSERKLLQQTPETDLKNHKVFTILSQYLHSTPIGIDSNTRKGHLVRLVIDHYLLNTKKMVNQLTEINPKNYTREGCKNRVNEIINQSTVEFLKNLKEDNQIPQVLIEKYETLRSTLRYIAYTSYDLDSNLNLEPNELLNNILDTTMLLINANIMFAQHAVLTLNGEIDEYINQEN